MAEKEDGEKTINGSDFLKMMMGNKTHDERMVEKEGVIQQRVLGYLERVELPFAVRLQYCQRWLEKTLAERKAEKDEKERLAEKHQCDMDRRRSEDQSEEDRQMSGMVGVAWLIGLWVNGIYQELLFENCFDKFGMMIWLEHGVRVWVIDKPLDFVPVHDGHIWNLGFNRADGNLFHHK